MSARPIEQKKRRRVAKALRRQPLPASFDLWTWLIQHGHAKTRKAARELILAGRVKKDSHVVGIDKSVPKFKGIKDGQPIIVEEDEAARYIPAKLRRDLVVTA